MSRVRRSAEGTTMFLSSPTTDDIIRAATASGPPKDHVSMILLGGRSAVSVPEMIEGLNRRGVSFFGGIFPGIIHGDSVLEDGGVILDMPVLHPPTVVRNLSAIKEVTPRFPELPRDAVSESTAIVLTDGLAAGVSPFIQTLLDCYGNFVNYLGGGAGSMSLRQAPCLFSNEGFFQDAAVVALVRRKSAIGVRHGWGKLAGPVVATRTDGNVISELNWEGAYDVYRAIVESESGQTLTRENFFSISMGYPFGIIGEGSEDIVRDPIARTDGTGIVCVGDVAENAVLNVLKGDKSKLIASAGLAAEECLSRCTAGEDHRCLVFDCISRALYLKEDFSGELSAIRDTLRAGIPDVDVLGVLSIGEISSYGEVYMEIFNKTAVVGILYR